MKQNKSFISTILAFCMMLSLVQPVFALQLSGTLYTEEYNSIGLKKYSRELQISDKGHLIVQRAVEGEYWTEYKYGLISLDGTQVIPYEYDYIEHFIGDIYRVSNYDAYIFGAFIRSDGSFVDVPWYMFENDFTSVRGVVINNHVEVEIYDYDKEVYSYKYYTANMEEVNEDTALSGLDTNYIPMGDIEFLYEYDEDANRYMGTVLGSDGNIILGPSEEHYADYWFSDTYFYMPNHYTALISDNQYYSSILPYLQQVDGVKSTVFMDYATGEIYGEFPYWMSNINADGFYAYENDNGTVSLAQTNQHYWITGEAPPEEDNTVYTPLSNATLYSSYLETIPDVGQNSAIISGSMPLGVGLYPDGTIGGIPRATGTYKFVVSTSEGDVGYSITVQDNSSVNVEADNDFEIIQRIPTVDSNEQDYVFKVSGEFSQFLNLYLDGVLLIEGVDYSVEEGSTIALLFANTMAQLNKGTHTINATYEPQGITATAVSAPVTVEKVAQTFEKTVEKTTVPAIPFTDVSQEHWFYDPIEFVYKKGTFSGTTPTTFAPDATMTRGMMATVLYALAGRPETAVAGFPDLVPGIWYETAVNWLGTTGISDSTTNFRPDDAITREETAQMLYNFCVDQDIWLPLTTSGVPKDIDTVSEYTKTHVTALFQRGIFAGDDFGNFNPQKTANRAEVSTVMKNFISSVL